MYIASNKGAPAPIRKGTYGTPRIIGGRVHPLNSTSFFTRERLTAAEW